VDFEKIRILKGQAVKSPDKKIQALWHSFERYLSIFTTEHEFNEEKITNEVNTGRDMIDELSDKMDRK
jgi:hypothetical protein